MCVHQSYEVIRFVGQNGKFHIVMDCVEGELLSTFLQKEETMNKRFFLRLMSEVAKELEGLEKSNATEYFPYLTPFHVVIKADQGVAFLKFNEKYHRKVEKMVQQFLPADGTNNYFYSYGRVLQFVLMKIRLRPRLTKIEEFKIKRIISKCLEQKEKRRFQNAREIVGKIKAVRSKGKVFALFIVVLGLITFSGLVLKKNEPQLVEQIDPDQQLQAYMAGKCELTEKEIEGFLNTYEEERGDSMKLAEREWFMEVCYRVNTEYSRQKLKEHGEALLNEVVAKRELLANLYMEDGELEQAVEEYQILVTEKPTVERYMVLTRLIEESGRNKDALEVCKSGCKMFPEREEIQLQYVTILLKDINVSKEEKEEELSRFLKEFQALEKNESFIRLIQEFSILEVNDV